MNGATHFSYLEMPIHNLSSARVNKVLLALSARDCGSKGSNPAATFSLESAVLVLHDVRSFVKEGKSAVIHCTTVERLPGNQNVQCHRQPKS